MNTLKLIIPAPSLTIPVVSAKNTKAEIFAAYQEMVEQLKRLSSQQKTVSVSVSVAIDDEPVKRFFLLRDYGPKKINVIKLLRAFFPGLGLKQAKELVESGDLRVSETTFEGSAAIRHNLSGLRATNPNTETMRWWGYPGIDSGVLDFDPEKTPLENLFSLLQGFGADVSWV